MKTRKLRAVSAILLSIIMLATTFSAAFAARPESTDLVNVNYYTDWSFYPVQKRFSYDTTYTHAIQLILYYYNKGSLQSTLGSIDGKYGPGTENAVKAFQTALRIGVDGKVGPDTWQALRSQLYPVDSSVATNESGVLSDDNYIYMHIATSTLWSFRYNSTTHAWQYSRLPTNGKGPETLWTTFYPGN